MIFERGQVAAVLPGYTLGATLGRGAFGDVLAATDEVLGRQVAVKVLGGGGPDGPSAAKLTAEARVLAGLDHPHVVRVHRCLEAEGLCLVVMEHLAGGTLTRRVDQLTPEQGCAVGLAVAAALGHVLERQRCVHGHGQGW